MAHEGTHNPGEVTLLLRRSGAGDISARDELLRVLYNDLRGMARYAMASGNFGYLRLDATAVVNDACGRLLGRNQLAAEDGRHFRYLMARAMHDVLVEEARKADADKRPNERRRVELQDTIDGSANRTAYWDVLDLHQALEELRLKDPDGAQLIELRFYGGCTLEETAELMGTTLAIVRRNWTYARAWLAERLTPGP